MITIRMTARHVAAALNDAIVMYDCSSGSCRISRYCIYLVLLIFTVDEVCCSSSGFFFVYPDTSSCVH